MKQELIAGIVMSLIGVLLVAAPRIVWKIAESWKNKEKDGPSRTYLVIVRIVGAVCIITAIAVSLSAL